MALVETLFSEYPDGAPADWTDFWGTGDFTAVVESNAAGDIDFGTKWLKYESTVLDISALTWDDLGSMSDVCVVAKIRAVNATSGGIRIYLRVAGSAGSENAYYFRMASAVARISKLNGGVDTTLLSKGYGTQAGKEYWAKFQVIETALKAKIWNADNVEPDDWHIETTDSDLASGAVGIGAYEATQDFYLDYIGVDSSEINMPVAYEDDVYFSHTHMATVSATFMSSSRGMGGQFIDADRKLKGVSLYCKDTHDDQVRIAVYSGGALGTGPQGATLLKDFGLTSGSDINQYIEITTTDDIDIPNNTPLWIIVKGDNAAGFKYTYDTNSVDSGNFQTVRGRVNISGIIGNDPDVAFADTFPAGAASFGNYWFSWKILTEEDTGIDETSRLVTITTTVSESDDLNIDEEDCEITISSTVNVTDIQTYVDIELTITISGAVSETDVQAYSDINLLVVILETTTIGNEFMGFDELSRLINLSFNISETDIQTYKDLQTLVSLTLTPTVSDIQTYIDTGLAISSTLAVSVFDSIPYNDTDLLISITSAISAADNQGYAETLTIPLSMEITKTDIQTYVDDMLILMGMSVAISDTTYEQLLISMAMSLAAIDGYATDTTRQAYELISREKSFELIGRTKTYYLEKG